MNLEVGQEKVAMGWSRPDSFGGDPQNRFFSHLETGVDICSPRVRGVCRRECLSYFAVYGAEPAFNQAATGRPIV